MPSTRLLGIGRYLRLPTISKRTIMIAPNHFGEFQDPMAHATGLEKRERLAYKAGQTDPFGIKSVIKRSAGTKECPTLIPSCFEGRLVGCVCFEDRRFVQWMWLERGTPKRCECGFWFKIKEIEPF